MQSLSFSKFVQNVNKQNVLASISMFLFHKLGREGPEDRFTIPAVTQILFPGCLISLCFLLLGSCITHQDHR